MTVVRPAPLLLLVALGAFAPQLLLSEWRGTEARRVQIAAEMRQSGEWLVPTLHGERTFAKPPLHYWLLAAAQQALGDTKAAARLPSVLGFWLLAVAAWRALRGPFGTGAAWIGALGVLGAPAVLYHAATAEIDATFAAWTGLSLLALARGAAAQGRGLLVLGGVLGGLAVLTKGPPYLMFLAGPLLVWLRRRRAEGWPWFLVPLLLVVAACYVPLLATAGRDVLRVGGDESVGRLALLGWEHVLGTPRYLVRAALLLLPLGLWTFYEWRGSEQRAAEVAEHETWLRMCAAALVGAILLLACFPGRPTRYLLPGVPLYAIAVAPAVAAYARDARPLLPATARLLFALGVLGALGLAALPFVPAPLPLDCALLLAALAALPPLVRSPRRLTAVVLALPLLGAATALPEVLARQHDGLESHAAAAAILRRQLDAHGVKDLEGRGHVPAQVVLELGRSLHGDEAERRQPTARWLLIEDNSREWGLPPPVVAGYAERARVFLEEKSLVLLERTGG
jgi:4-amino-4-deoxy-L-arabinose transferase-like glycosyltransferase